MSLQLWFYWFPLALLVALSARYLSRLRSSILSFIAAVFWIAFAVSSSDIFLSGMASVVHVVAVAIAAGLLPAIVLGAARPRQHVRTEAISMNVSRESDDSLSEALIAVPRRFDDWLCSHCDLADPWPDFGEFVRETLLSCCGASQIRAYRLLLPDDNTLLPLHETAPKERDFPPLRSGIRGYVATSGLSFYENDQGADSLSELADLGSDPCVWCFSVRVHGYQIGVIQVGELPQSSLSSRPRLRLVEGLIALCWSALTEACRSRLADDTDSVAGVLTPEAFLGAAGRSLKDAYAKSEPVAVVSFDVEGLRRLTDRGEWEVAKDAIRRVSEIVRERIREDDCAGFFDGSRFVVMLCRVDAELAQLIVKKIQSHIGSMFGSLGAPGNQLGVRCGLAGSGATNPTLRELIARASASCASAREQGVGLWVHTGEVSEVVSP